MEAYVAVLNYAIPFFFLLLLIEVIVAKYQGAKVIRSMDTLSSLSSGLTNAIKDVLGLTVVVVSYAWVVEHVALFEIKSTLAVYALAFIGLDFAGYWVHRLSHKVNYFWNRHIIHHSSEEFNLGCALRQSISGFVGITVFFLIPIAFLGVPAEVVAVVAPIHLFAQYWYHTRLIDKMGILEYIIVTPSHHRVHHAINKEYMDKNLSQIFIFWDKLFGTFQEELDEVPPVYGVTRPVRTWNPIIINFQHLWLLIQDAWRTKSLIAKFKIWFMPTGWRPEDVKEKYPVYSIKDANQYKKFDPKVSGKLQLWSWIQFFFSFVMMMYLFNILSKIDFASAIVFGLFITLCIFAYSMLMDKLVQAWWMELIKSVIGIGLIFQQGDWFLLDTFTNGFGSWFLLGYFVVAVLITSAFVFYELRPGMEREVMV